MRNRLKMVSEWSYLILASILDDRFRWWKRVRKSKILQIGRKSSYKPILAWKIDWNWLQIDPTWFWPPFLMIGSVDKWFQDDPISLSWSSAPLMKKSPKIEKCSKLVENHLINHFWYKESIVNGFRMTQLLFLDHCLPWWKVSDGSSNVPFCLDSLTITLASA